MHRVEERRRFTNKWQEGRGQSSQQKQERTNFPTSTRPIVNCKFCGRQHERKKEMCPAWGQVCSKCNKRNHYSRCCPPDVRSKVHVIDEQSSDVEYEQYEDSVLTVYTDESIRHVSTGPLYTEMMLPNKTSIKLQIDSGATVNVISAKHVDVNNVTSSSVKLKMYNNTSSRPLGKCLLLLKNPANGRKHCVEFQVVQEDFIPLLSRRAAEGMGLITVNYSNFRQLHSVMTKCEALTEEFKSVFDTKTLGCLNGPVTLRTDDATKPVTCPPRRVPIAMQTKLRCELDGLVDLKVITPVTKPTEWCSQISVQTKKNGRLRICIDPRPLNEVLQRETYPLPTIEDLLPELANARVFSKVDLSNGYWHCELDEASSLLTTFVTPYGRYRWLRLPFDLEGLKGVVCVADDILIFGISDADHD